VTCEDEGGLVHDYDKYERSVCMGEGGRVRLGVDKYIEGRRYRRLMKCDQDGGLNV
jgi:hypothetical protein